MITESPDPSKTAAGRSDRFMFSFGVAFEGLREMPRRLTYAAAGGCIECDVFRLTQRSNDRRGEFVV